MQITDLVYIDSTGYHFADYPTFQAWLIAQYQTIYGADVDLSANTQDGQFIAILAQSFYDMAAVGGAVFNSFSPVTAQGVGLSRVVKINGIKRKVPSFSTVTLTIVGVGGTVISNGIATDSLGNKWALPATVTIPGGGSIAVTGTAEVAGALAAAPSTITTIFTPTLGWQTVNNAGAAALGAPVESDAELRIRQALSTADPSLTVLEGTAGAVSNLPGVTKVNPYENDTDSTDANSVPSHSIAIGVVGGVDQDIAQEIFNHKGPGCGTYGNTSEDVTDDKGVPATINFNRPTNPSIQATVTLASGTGWSSDYEDLIKTAVAAQINALPIGGTVVASQLILAAYLIGTAPGLTYTITTLVIGISSGMQSGANIDLTYNQNGVCDPDTDVTVVVT